MFISLCVRGAMIKMSCFHIHIFEFHVEKRASRIIHYQLYVGEIVRIYPENFDIKRFAGVSFTSKSPSSYGMGK